jgi:hypothetical protein
MPGRGHVRILGGGALPTTQFSDTLIGADQPFIFGDAWIPAFISVDGTTVGTQLAGQVNRGATGLTFTGAGAFLGKGFGFPFTMDLGTVNTRRQFVQFQVVSNPAGIARLSGVCYANPNPTQYYEMLMVTEVSQLALNRVNGLGTTNLIVQGPATAYVNGDILRMECDPLTTPGTTTIRLFKNGVQIGATINDNAGARLFSGLTGLLCNGANPAVATTISNYSGGAL